MKKRILSMLLALCLVVGTLPVFAMRSDAVIGSIIKVGLKVCKSVVSGTIQTIKHADYYNGNIGKAVLGQFKNIGADLTGLDVGDDYGESGGGQVVVNVSMDEVEAQLKTINSALEKNEIAINQLSSTVTSGMQSISKQLDSLSQQLKDSTETIKYYTYLNEFFSFFNQYYEALSYYDNATSAVIADNASDELVKNTFDQFYHLQNVEYTGSLHSAVDKLGKYLRGEYMTSDPGGVVDVLSRYYILGYKAEGKSEAEAEELAAQATEEMIAHIYYAYCMGVHFEETVTLYQSTYMEEHDTTEYVTDFGSHVSMQQLSTQLDTLMESVPVTVSYIFGALLDNYTMQSFNMPYCSVYEDSSEYCNVYASGSYWYSRNVSFSEGFAVNPGSYFYLPDVSVCLSDSFSDELRESFEGICSYTSDSARLELDGVKVSVKSYDAYSNDFTENCRINAVASGHTVTTLDVKFNHIKYDNRKGWDGDGSEDYPYLITTPHFLYGMNDSSDYFVLAGDLDFSKESGGYTELGKYGSSLSIKNFSGVFDGNGHTIKNLQITGEFQDNMVGEIDGWSGAGGERKQMYGVGLFGNLSGTVRNLNVENFKLDYSTSISVGADVYAGVIAGYVCGGSVSRCTVKESYVKVQVTCPDSSKTCLYTGGIAGGVFGGNGASVTDCSFIDNNGAGGLNGTVESTPQGFLADTTNAVGGIVGVIGRNGYNESSATGKFPMLANPETNTGLVEGCQIYIGSTKNTNRYFSVFNGSMMYRGGVVGYIQNGELSDSWYGAYCEVLYRFYANNRENIGRLVGGAQNPQSIKGTLAFVKIPGVNVLWESADICGTHSDSELTNADYQEFNTYLEDRTFRNHMSNNLTHTYKYDSELEYYVLTTLGGSSKNRITLPVKTEYCAGEYLDLTGMIPYIVDKNDSVLSPAAAYTFSETTMELINNPLTAGEHTIELNVGGGAAPTINFKISVSDHVYYGETVPATCTEKGYDSWICYGCGDVKYEEHEALGFEHSYTSVVTPPTRTEQGYTTHTCTTCGYTYIDTYVDYVIPGDVNDDGYVTLADVTLLMKYLAGWNVTINAKAADTNGDENATLADVTLLMKYLANWNVTLG